MTLALSLGFSLGCCLQTPAPSGRVRASGRMLHAPPLDLLGRVDLSPGRLRQGAAAEVFLF